MNDDRNGQPDTVIRAMLPASCEYRDITDEFLQSVEELELGELLHYELFGLFEAMSAIEMMDKKMDIGMLDGKDRNVPLTFETAVKVRISSQNFHFARFIYILQ